MSIEQRLARLEAIEAIKQLKHRYFHACDTKQTDRVRDCFAEGVIDLRYGRIGEFSDRQQMLAVFTELACQDHIIEMHHGQNPQIELLGEDRATGIWGLYYYMIDTRRNTATQLAGFYEDEYAFVDGQWRIVKSHYEVTSTQILALEDSAVKALFAGASAPLSVDDPAKQAG
ncbi:MAG: nuclear transport factor 2 family protein [Gammaproteobacteria bacterium]|jgi:hypothetical protein|nr:nuclear transport factor 2 family protein [Gammaproteobacteria bacterium]